MNNYRLSTKNKNFNKENDLKDNLWDKKVIEFLSKPSNFEIHPDGKILIKSENTYWKGRGNVCIEVYNEQGLLNFSFENLEKTGNFFNVSKQIIRYRLDTGKPLKIENNKFYFKRAILM